MASANKDDWQWKKSVLESNKHMFEKQLYCDVTFVIKTDEKQVENTISAHKYVLISRSPVFCAMFEGPAKDESGRVEIDDVDKDSFVEMLKYLYFEEANLCGENVLTVLYCAKKYMISGLMEKCSTFLEEQLDHNNVCFVLEQANLFDENELEEKCLKLIDGCASETLTSSGFTNIEKRTLEAIVKRDTLDAEEVEVYRACLRWAEDECGKQEIEANDQNRRQVLGDVIHLVRFSTMELDDFLKEVSSSEILSSEEAFNLVLVIKGSKPRRSLPFSTDEREGIWTEEFFKSLTVVPYGNMGCVTVRQPQPNIHFQITYCKKNEVRIKSVFIINPSNCNLTKVSIQNISQRFSTDQVGVIKKLEGRFLNENQLYEVEFQPYFKAEVNTTTNVSLKYSGSPTLLQGKQTIGDPNRGKHVTHGLFGQPIDNPIASNVHPEDVTIVMQATQWNSVVGFKYKIR